MKTVIYITTNPRQLVDPVIALFQHVYKSYYCAQQPYPTIHFHRNINDMSNPPLCVKILPPLTKHLCGQSADVVFDLCGVDTADKWFRACVRPMVIDGGAAIKL
jgi:hypothetical protein